MSTKVEKGKFVLVELRSSVKVALVHNRWNNEIVGIEDIPDREEQGNYIWNEGPSGVYDKQILREIDTETLFCFLRAQIIFERIRGRFTEIESLMPIIGKERSLIVILNKLTTRDRRRQICEAMLGVYPRKNVYFCASDNESVNVVKAQKSLLDGKLPLGWEITQSDDTVWRSESLFLESITTP